MSLKKEYIRIGKIKFPMKIAIIGSRGYPYVYSGYETFVKEISERFVKKKISVVVYCHKELFKEKPKKVNGIDLVYIPTIQSKSLSQFIHSFFSVIHFCFSDVKNLLVVNVANAPFGFLTFLFKKKIIINVDGMEWLRPKWKGIGQKYFKFCAKIVKYSFDHIITDSEQMKKIYQENFSTYSSVIKYGPIKSNVQSSQILKKLRLKKESFFLVIGRLIPDNNADMIINEFLDSPSNKKLVIVGDVPYKSSYSYLLKKRGGDSVIFTGYISKENELADLYRYCFVYIHGHEFGGTNPTLINAINFNCRILALDTIFNREMLKDGEYGTFFKKNDKSLTSLFKDLKTKCHDKLITNRKKYIEKNYNWELIAKQYIDVFEQLKP